MYDWCIKGKRYRSGSFLNIAIRQEQIEDYEITERVVECAFASAEHSDKKEISWFLVLENPLLLFQNYL
jgi:hypothetical protein